MGANGEPAFKLITAVLPGDRDALGVVDGLRTDLGVRAADVHLGRGSSHLSPRRFGRRFGDMLEKQVLTAVVRADQAEAAFAYVHDKAGIGRAHGGILYQQPLARATEYRLPDVAKE